MVVVQLRWYACRSYAVKVEVSPEQVVWSAWAEVPPVEAWLGGLLRPMVFDRDQYQAEIALSPRSIGHLTQYDVAAPSSSMTSALGGSYVTSALCRPNR